MGGSRIFEQVITILERGDTANVEDRARIFGVALLNVSKFGISKINVITTHYQLNLIKIYRTTYFKQSV